uniref:Uncharacterized protein n=1 Tax=Oryza brachyantha TaxID=4533 RepID=J3MK90_ORYBR
MAMNEKIKEKESLQAPTRRTKNETFLKKIRKIFYPKISIMLRKLYIYKLFIYKLYMHKF